VPDVRRNPRRSDVSTERKGNRMAFEKIQYTTTRLSRTIGMVDMLFFVGGPSLAGWLLTKDSSTALLYGFYGFIGVALLRGIARYMSSRRSFLEAKSHLLQHGFNADLEIARNFSIDTIAGKIAFMQLATMSYDLYDTFDILGCEHQWIEKHDSNGRLTKEKNVLVFRTRNPHTPLYKFNFFSHEQGELWLARVNAVLNR
jgi:hypothetical protein